MKRPRFRKLKLARDRGVEAVGIALIAFGCLVTALVWAGVRESTNVSYQLPIIASGGLVAVGCFTVGGMLVVGGMVMTRFARQESARRAGAAVPDDAEVLLPEEVAARQDDGRQDDGHARGTVSSGTPAD